jgi:hypothetical protein
MEPSLKKTAVLAVPLPSAYALEVATDEQQMNKHKLDMNQAMLAIIWCRIFCLPICYPKI